MRVLSSKKGGCFFIAVVVFFICSVLAVDSDAVTQKTIWKNISSNIKDSDLHIVEVDPLNLETVYASSLNALFKTTNGGKSWDEILSFRGTGNTINSIAIHPLDTKIIHAGTKYGLFRSEDNGLHWKRILKGIGELENSVLSVAINPKAPEQIYIGTNSGIFYTYNDSSDWTKSILPSDAAVFSIAIDYNNPKTIYAATNRGIYKSADTGKQWQRIFEINNPNEETTEQDSSTEEEETTETDGIEMRHIVIDPSDNNKIYAGTSKGLLITKDAGTIWETANNSGLISSDIHRLAINSADPDSVYAATSRGVFKYSVNTAKWTELYKGLYSTHISYLASSPDIQELELWAATDKGVFKTVALTDERIAERENALSIFADEPSIKEIQETAIRYAEVHPEKIEGWRKAAANKAWLPDLTIGYDRDRDWQRSNYFYGGTYRSGDDITQGRDFGWSVSVSWDLGDLIYNDDQTSIDTRSRLMVQLRDDVLNEVTRLYFERRRLQLEMFLSPPEKTKDRIEKELRLQELTADIDALTGFYLSKKLNQTKDKILQTTLNSEQGKNYPR